jgi:hypothetical protein
VAVDPDTRQIYLPLQNINGHDQAHRHERVHIGKAQEGGREVTLLRALELPVSSAAARRPGYTDVKATAASASTCPISGSHGARISSSQSVAL